MMWIFSIASALVVCVCMAHGSPVPAENNTTLFNFTDCSVGQSPMFVVMNVSVGPNPVEIPGLMEMGVEGELLEEVEGPVQLAISIAKVSELEEGEVVPCSTLTGPCIIDDICPTLESSTCPQEYVQLGYTCKCPFQPGNVSYSASTMFAGASILSPGSYVIQVTAQSKGRLVTCVELSGDFS
ncbi:ganglioside GM2 activator [Aplysia californica]|uniref:Ganglioside GM2 activator n=1 Tax=Aplysia californica TaxID=6500 RepID=A0ABM1A455_APLCA|nr:ganglioside GM2 activator [Aplysia californica]